MNKNKSWENNKNTATEDMCVEMSIYSSRAEESQMPRPFSLRFLSSAAAAPAADDEHFLASLMNPTGIESRR